jgi:hypothetical protein
MDGGRQTTQLEIHVTQIRHVVAFATAMVACASVAEAQRYRVELAVPGGKTAIAEFHPCVPAEGSDCGAWVDRTVESVPPLPGLATNVVSPNGHDSVSVAADGRVRITSLAGRKPPVILLRVGKGTARGIAVSADSRYAFVVVENLTGNPVDVMMIDLDTQSGIAGLVMETRVLGIGMAP